MGDALESTNPELQELKRRLEEPTRTIEATVEKPVLVSEDIVRRIWNRLEKEAGQPVAIYKTIDGRITSWRCVEEALEQANTTSKKIEGIYIKNEDSSKYGQVEIAMIAGGRIRMHVFSDEQSAERLFADLEAAIGTGIRHIPGYAWMAKKGNLGVRVGAVLVLLYGLAKLPFGAVVFPEFALERLGAVPLLAALSVTVVGLGALWVVRSVDRMFTALIQRYWPMVALEIGNGRAREQGASRVRKACVGLIIALVVGATLKAVGNL